jgi:hypothetical protein
MRKQGTEQEDVGVRLFRWEYVQGRVVIRFRLLRLFFFQLFFLLVTPARHRQTFGRSPSPDTVVSITGSTGIICWFSALPR